MIDTTWHPGSGKLTLIEIALLLGQFFLFTFLCLAFPHVWDDVGADVAYWTVIATFAIFTLLMVVNKIGRSPNQDFDLKATTAASSLLILLVCSFATNQFGSPRHNFSLRDGNYAAWILMCLGVPLLQTCVVSMVFRHTEGVSNAGKSDTKDE